MTTQKMTLQRPKTRYQLLREQDEDYVERRWTKGKTVLKWERREPDPEFAEDEVHDLSFAGRSEGWYHTPGQICRPDLQFMGHAVKLCDKHQAELDELIATSPPVTPINEDEDIAFYQYHDQTVKTDETTIRQEFARKGILVLSPRPSDDRDDDPFDVADTYDSPTAYTTVDAETIGLIELEKKMYRNGPVRSIVRKGDKLQMRGYDDLPIDQQREVAKDYLRKWKLRYPEGLNEKRAEAWRQLNRKLNQAGEKATLFRLYSIKNPVPPQYYEMDEDPYRYELAQTDMDLHDVHAIVEPKDPDADPALTPLLPEDYEVRFYLRGIKVPDMGEADAFERNRTLRNVMMHRQLHVGNYISPSLSGDHDMAESEWDLGIEFIEQEQLDPEWVQDLLSHSA